MELYLNRDDLKDECQNVNFSNLSFNDFKLEAQHAIRTVGVGIFEENYPVGHKHYEKKILRIT